MDYVVLQTIPGAGSQTVKQLLELINLLRGCSSWSWIEILHEQILLSFVLTSKDDLFRRENSYINIMPFSIHSHTDWHTCFINISLRRLWPQGLYFRLNLSNRWNILLSACMSNVSTFRSWPVRSRDSNTSLRVRYFPSLNITNSSGSFLNFDFMNLSKCFWCMQAEWCTCVSTWAQIGTKF